MRPRIVLAAAGSVGLVAGIQATPTGALDHGADVSPLPSGTPNEGQRSYLMREYGFSTERADVALDREATAESLLDRVVAGRVKRDWAGAWIDHADGSTVHLAVTTDEAATALEGQQLPRFVVVDRVRHTVEELRSQRARLRKEVVRRFAEDGGEPGDALQSVGWYAALSLDTNSVRVRPEAGSELEGWVNSALDSIEGLDAVRVQPVPKQLGVDDSASVNCISQGGDCFPMQAGIQINGVTNQTSQGNCTTGFTFVRNGARLASTAAHCSGTQWKHNSKDIGPTSIASNTARVDVRTVTITDHNSWKASNIVWRPGADALITSKISSPNNSLQGITVCQVGFGKSTQGHPAESCGPILSIDGESNNWDQMGIAHYRDCRGDSGGPVFNGGTGRAYGMVRGKIGPGPFPPCAIGGAYESAFSWVPYMESAVAAQVLTSG